jgi:DNA-binding transcriptional ArsR family regulator
VESGVLLSPNDIVPPRWLDGLTTLVVAALNAAGEPDDPVPLLLPPQAARVSVATAPDAASHMIPRLFKMNGLPSYFLEGPAFANGHLRYASVTRSRGSTRYDATVAGKQAINSGLAERPRRAGPGLAAESQLMRVRFTTDDLLLTRFGEAPAPLAEVSAGLLEMRRPSAAARPGRWVIRAKRAFPATARPLLDLMPTSLPSPTFVDPVVPGLDEGLEIVRATPRSVLRAEVPASWRGAGRPPSWLRALVDGDREAMDTVVRALRDFYLACVAPYWSRIVATFHADVAERIPVLATGGLAGVLGTLHDDLAWRDNTLVRSWQPGECSLGGRGLQLLPSALWTGPPLMSGHLRESGGNALIYAARSAVPASVTGQSCDLAGLMGHTRAAVLEALRTPRSTAELAAWAGTSAPSASEHAAALRASGLVQTVRRGRGVNHSLTPLGRSLLNGNLNAH